MRGASYPFDRGSGSRHPAVEFISDAVIITLVKILAVCLVVVGVMMMAYGGEAFAVAAYWKNSLPTIPDHYTATIPAEVKFNAPYYDFQNSGFIEKADVCNSFTEFPNDLPDRPGGGFSPPFPHTMLFGPGKHLIQCRIHDDGGGTPSISDEFSVNVIFVPRIEFSHTPDMIFAGLGIQDVYVPYTLPVFTHPAFNSTSCSPPPSMNGMTGTYFSLSAQPHAVTCAASNKDGTVHPTSADFTISIEDRETVFADPPQTFDIDLARGTHAVIDVTAPGIKPEMAGMVDSVVCDTIASPVGESGILCHALDSAGDLVETQIQPVNVVKRPGEDDTDILQIDLPTLRGGPYPVMDGSAGLAIDYDQPNSTNAVVTCTHNPGDTFTEGETTVYCTATDGTVHATNTFEITVVEDLEPPINNGGPPMDQFPKFNDAQGYMIGQQNRPLNLVFRDNTSIPITGVPIVCEPKHQDPDKTVYPPGVTVTVTRRWCSLT